MTYLFPASCTFVGAGVAPPTLYVVKDDRPSGRTGVQPLSDLEEFFKCLTQKCFSTLHTIRHIWF